MRIVNTTYMSLDGVVQRPRSHRLSELKRRYDPDDVFHLNHKSALNHVDPAVLRSTQ